MRFVRLLIAAFLLVPANAGAQTITGRAPVAVSFGAQAGGAASGQAGPSISLTAPLPLRNISFGSERPAIAPQPRARAVVHATGLGVVLPAAPALSLYKEESPAKSQAESLAGLIEGVKTADEKPAGQAFTVGHSIMDRVLGIESRRDSGISAGVEIPIRASKGDSLERPSRQAAQRNSVPPALGKFAEKAAMFGIGAFSLAGTIASVHPLMAVVVYVTMIVPSLILHEMAHAKVAEILGDTKQREAGRLSFTGRGLKTHFDLTNTILLPAATLWASGGGMVLGAAKPLDIHYGFFSRPIRDMAKVAIAGPAVHVALALAGAAALGLAGALGIGGLIVTALALFSYYNVNLALVNLLPIFPADANHILRAALHRISPNLVTALDGFYARLGIWNRLPLWLTIAALSLTGVLKAAALAVAGAFLGHAVLAAGLLAASAAGVFFLLRRRAS